jgi:hypothetical protein
MVERHAERGDAPHSQSSVSGHFRLSSFWRPQDEREDKSLFHRARPLADHSRSTTSFPTWPFPDMLSLPSPFEVSTNWQGYVRCRQGLPTALTARTLSRHLRGAHAPETSRRDPRRAQLVPEPPQNNQKNNIGGIFQEVERGSCPLVEEVLTS